MSSAFFPQIGKEHEWLHERAAHVARHSAEQHGMVQMGEFYRVPWRSCAWHAAKWMEKKLNPLNKRAQPKAEA